MTMTTDDDDNIRHTPHMWRAGSDRWADPLWCQKKISRRYTWFNIINRTWQLQHVTHIPRESRTPSKHRRTTNPGGRQSQIAGAVPSPPRGKTEGAHKSFSCAPSLLPAEGWGWVRRISASTRRPDFVTVRIETDMIVMEYFWDMTREQGDKKGKKLLQFFRFVLFSFFFCS